MFKIKVIQLTLLLLFGVFTGLSSRASQTTGQVAGSFLLANPSGGALQGAILTSPIPDRAFWVGPRIGILWVRGGDQNQLDFQGGLEGSIWLLNAIGLGLGADIMSPSFVDFMHHPNSANSVSQSLRYRLDPFLGLRFLHFHKNGAWAFRFGVPYDTHYRWGVHFGMTLQFSGVPRIGIGHASEETDPHK